MNITKQKQIHSEQTSDYQWGEGREEEQDRSRGLRGTNYCVQNKQTTRIYGLPWWPRWLESACNARDPGSIPGLGRSSREGHGNPLQYSFLENPMDRGAWWAMVHRVAKSQTQLRDSHFHFTFTVQPREYSQHFAIKTVWY